MKQKEIENILKSKGLKATIQRMAVLEAVIELKNHPNAEKIISFIKKKHPVIAIGTVYKTLELLIENDLINKIKSDGEQMRYDAITQNHHHLYSIETDEIVDYYNEEIDKILTEFFIENNIPGFDIKDIKLQITGNFKH